MRLTKLKHKTKKALGVSASANCDQKRKGNKANTRVGNFLQYQKLQVKKLRKMLVISSLRILWKVVECYTRNVWTQQLKPPQSNLITWTEERGRLD